MRPNIERLIMPSEYTKKSLFERPIGSVVIENVLIVLHVLRQFLKRHQIVSLSSLVSDPIVFLAFAFSVFAVVVGTVYAQPRILIHLSFSSPPNRPFIAIIIIVIHCMENQSKPRC